MWNFVIVGSIGTLWQRHGNKSGSKASVNAAAVLNADGSRKFLPLLVTLGSGPAGQVFSRKRQEAASLNE